jgi:pyrrolidone-carboxylate peptidase
LQPCFPHIAIERIAVNVMDLPIPDNAGTQHRWQSRLRGRARRAYGYLPVRTIATPLRKSSVLAQASNLPSKFSATR